MILAISFAFIRLDSPVNVWTLWMHGYEHKHMDEMDKPRCSTMMGV